MELPRLNPYLVTVHGISHGQMVINTFGYRAADSGGTSAGSSSQLFLENFRQMWRDFILPVMYPAYSVYRYWIRRIDGVEVVPGTDPVSYKPVFGIFQDFYPGNPAQDTGLKAAVTDYLPEFVAMTGTRIHTSVGRRYWRSSVRIGPHTEADQGTVPNEFNTARVTEVDNALQATVNQNIEDGLGAANDWVHATFSPTYYGRFVVGIPGPIRDATLVVTGYQTGTIVTTQLSRKFRSSSGN